MASLTGTKIKDTYPSILKVFDNGALDGTVQVITDGLGNSSALWLGTGAATITGDMSVWENFSVDTDTLVVDSIQDRVGINVGSPTEALDVLGNIKASGTLRVSGNARFDTNVYVGGVVANVDDLDTNISFGTNQVSLITGGLTRLSASDASVQVTNPLVASSTLSVTGNYNSTNGDIALANGKIAVGGSVSIANSVGAASFSPDANLLVLGDTGAGANQGMTIVSPTTSTGSIYFANGTTGNERYRGYVKYDHNSNKMYLGVNQTDLVMIDSGSANVTGNLNVSGSITGGNINPSTLNVSGNATFDTTTLVVDASNNRVGVGTASPSYKLHINTDAVSGRQNLDAINRTAQNFIRITNPQYSVDASAGILLRSFPDSDSRQGAGIIASGGGTNNQTDISLFVTNISDVSYSAYRIESDVHKFYNAPSSEAMRIDSGNVGIGETNPDSNNAGVDRVLQITSTRPSIRIKSSYSPSGADCEIVSETDGNMVFRNYYASGGIQLVTNGSERMRIDGQGSLLLKGAGTTSLLRFDSSSFGQIQSTGNTLYYDVDTQIFRSSAGSEAMRITSSGLVGIGTADPGDLLHIKSTTNDARMVLDGATGFDAELKFFENGAAKYTVGYDAATSNFVIGTANVDTQQRLVIDSSGNVGIGGNPTSFSGYVTVTTDASSGGIFDIKVNGTRTANFQASATEAMIDVKTAIPLIFNTSGSERMRILSSGGLTFNGDTSSANALDDYEEGTWTPTLISGFSSAPSGYSLQSGKYTKIGDVVYFFVDLDPNGATANASAVEIGGLPFAATSSSPSGGGYITYQTGFNTNASDLVHVGTSTSTILFVDANGNGRAGDAAGVNINSRVLIAGFYKV